MIRILALLALISFHGHAKLKVEEQIKTYQVNAESIDTLLSNVLEASPLVRGGDASQGGYKYKVSWTIRVKQTRKGTRCKVNTVRTKLKMTYTLPEILSDDPKVQEIAQAWIPKLTKYLKGHGALAEEYAVLIDEKIDSMKPQKTCEEVNLLASEYADGILDDLSKAVKKYKQGNNNGETEFAWLQQYLDRETTE